jgi:hypothetical protein
MRPTDHLCNSAYRLATVSITGWIFMPCLLLLFSATSGLAAQTFVGSAQTTGLMESYPDNNMGAVGWYPVGTIQNQACGTTNNPFACRNRSLIKFDFQGLIPPGSRILNVDFRVWVTVQPPNDETDFNTVFDFHRMLLPWGKGTGANGTNFPGAVGRPALPGESSWLMRLAPSNSWGIPGGAAGIDYATQSSALTQVFTEPGTQNDFIVSAISNRLVADVQHWVDNPGQNFGWLTKARNEADRWTAKRFMNIESGIDDYPRLLVTYVPPPDITNVQTNAGGVSFEFVADPAQAYIVQYRESLSAGEWLTLTNVPAPPGELVIPVIDPGTLTNSNRFYRVIGPQ